MSKQICVVHKRYSLNVARPLQEEPHLLLDSANSSPILLTHSRWSSSSSGCSCVQVAVAFCRVDRRLTIPLTLEHFLGEFIESALVDRSKKLFSNAEDHPVVLALSPTSHFSLVSVRFTRVTLAGMTTQSLPSCERSIAMAAHKDLLLDRLLLSLGGSFLY